MRPALLVAVAIATFAACRGRESDAGAGSGAARPGDVEAPLPAGETMRITSSDRVFDLALRNDSVVLSLSRRALGKVQQALDSVDADSTKGTMVGAMIARTIKSGAEKLASKTSGFPVRDIERVAYENGRLEFRLKDGKEPFVWFDQIKEGGRPVMEAFPPSDAQRFVDAVRAAKSTG